MSPRHHLPSWLCTLQSSPTHQYSVLVQAPKRSIMPHPWVSHQPQSSSAEQRCCQLSCQQTVDVPAGNILQKNPYFSWQELRHPVLPRCLPQPPPCRSAMACQPAAERRFGLNLQRLHRAESLSSKLSRSRAVQASWLAISTVYHLWRTCCACPPTHAACRSISAAIMRRVAAMQALCWRIHHASCIDKKSMNSL